MEKYKRLNYGFLNILVATVLLAFLEGIRLKAAVVEGTFSPWATGFFIFFLFMASAILALAMIKPEQVVRIGILAFFLAAMKVVQEISINLYAKQNVYLYALSIFVAIVMAFGGYILYTSKAIEKKTVKGIGSSMGIKEKDSFVEAMKQFPKF